jgi:hypothetical protein
MIVTTPSARSTTPRTLDVSGEQLGEWTFLTLGFVFLMLMYGVFSFFSWSWQV